MYICMTTGLAVPKVSYTTQPIIPIPAENLQTAPDLCEIDNRRYKNGQKGPI